MKSHRHRVYRSRNPLRLIFGVLFSVLLAAIILAVGVYFGFRKYIVYTSEGLRVEVPWLEEAEKAKLPEEK